MSGKALDVSLDRTTSSTDLPFRKDLDLWTCLAKYSLPLLEGSPTYMSGHFISYEVIVVMLHTVLCGSFLFSKWQKHAQVRMEIKGVHSTRLQQVHAAISKLDIQTARLLKTSEKRRNVYKDCKINESNHSFNEHAPWKIMSKIQLNTGQKLVI